MKQPALFGTEKPRVNPPLINGPANVPGGFRVSTTRQVAGIKSKPKATFTLATWFKFPAVPVTVIVAMPTLTGARSLAVNVSVVPDALLVGLKLAVIPCGSPDALKVTEPLNPLSGLIEMVEFTLPPCFSVTFAG